MFTRRGRQAERIAFLQTIPVFEGVPDDVLAHLDEHLAEIDVPAGRRLTTEGTAAYEAFIIGEGRAQVRVDGEVVGEAGPGELIGEVALLEGGNRTATTSALTDMTLLALNEDGIAWLMNDPTLAERVRSALARHLDGPQTSR